MNNRSLSIVLGISLLAGVLSTVIFQQTKYFIMYDPPREVTKKEYESMEYRSRCVNCAELAAIKNVLNYEVGGLVFISTFATLLIITNLKKK
jgi:hypothetical protein